MLETDVVRDQAKSLVEDFFEAVNRGALERFDQLVHPDYKDHLAGQLPGREAVREYFKSIRVTFPDLIMTILATVAEGDRIAVHNRIEGTHTGPMGDVPPTGRRMSVEAFQLYRIENGQLAEHWEVADVASLMRQLSAPDVPSAERPDSKTLAARKLNPHNAALLLIDHQAGLMLSVQTQPSDVLRSNVVSLAKIGRLFELPTVLTTSGGQGPNGPIISKVTELFGDKITVDRTLYFDCMMDPVFQEAVAATGRRKLIMAGITTDYCLALPAITAVEMGYDVYAVVDASGAWSPLIEQAAMLRMQQAGVKIVSWATVMAELQSSLSALDEGRARANQKEIVRLLKDQIAGIDFLIDMTAGAPIGR